MKPNAWGLLIVHIIRVREMLRDLVLLTFRRRLYVRCGNFLRTFRPCRRDATMSFDGEPPLYCAACDPSGVDVGRWERAPSWASNGRKMGALKPATSGAGTRAAPNVDGK